MQSAQNLNVSGWPSNYNHIHQHFWSPGLTKYALQNLGPLEYLIHLFHKIRVDL